MRITLVFRLDVFLCKGLMPVCNGSTFRQVVKESLKSWRGYLDNGKVLKGYLDNGKVLIGWFWESPVIYLQRLSKSNKTEPKIRFFNEAHLSKAL